MSLQRIGDLELDQDLPFERRQNRVQRAGWGVMTVLIVAALLGVFGSGPLSSATAGGEREGLTIGYERFVRRQGLASLTITVAARHVVNGEVALWIDQRYLDRVTIDQVTPQPREVRGSGDRQLYVFGVEGESGLTVQIEITPEAIGRAPGSIGVGDTIVSFTQWCYP